MTEQLTLSLSGSQVVRLLSSMSLSGPFKLASGGFGRRQWQPTPILLPGKSHGCRSLVGCSPDFTFTFHFHALEKEMATHSSVPAWRIPGTAEPGGLPSMGSHRVEHNWSDLAAAAAAGFVAAPPLISNCSNLLFGTQVRSWRLESYLWGTKKPLYPGAPRPCSSSEALI